MAAPQRQRVRLGADRTGVDEDARAWPSTLAKFSNQPIEERAIPEECRRAPLRSVVDPDHHRFDHALA